MIKVLVKSFTKDVSLPSKEDEAAILLQERMQEELSSCPEAKGSLYILTNVRIFGQKRNDMDMLVMGFFEGLTIKSVKTKNVGVVKELNVKSVICNVELKSHSAGKVVRKGTDYFVSYSGVWHNASRQCYEAKFSLWNHLADQLGVKPFICDILWFNGLSEADLSQMRGDMPDNALHRRFSFKDLIEAVLLQASVCKDGAGGFCLDSFSDGEKEFQNIVRLFTVERKPKGLTKVKFELISQKNTETDKLLSDIGKKLTIVTGRAGTGKTVQLLQLAFRLADEERANRCLLLTYNHALVSDIQRLIDYTPMPTRVDGRTVSIKTIHSFFHNLMKEFGIDVKGITPLKQNYEVLYDQSLQRLYTFIVDECEKEDIEALKDMTETSVDWDYLLIDEAQDFSDVEKRILFKLYGPQRLIVADGVDQFMRKGLRQEWGKGVDRSLLQKPKAMSLGRRQKANLVTFVNAFAGLAGLDWRGRPNDDLPGGEIKILPCFKKRSYNELKENCLRNGCENYDILILEPPSQVTVDEQGNRFFSKADVYMNRAKIPLFDGINTQNRATYPTKDQCRVYQYDSCRGLEGWCVVCADFDELIRYKQETYMADENTLGLDKEKAIERSVYLWSLMPLTRPVDTLVITLTDKDSAVGKMLEQLAGKYPDFVEWNF